MGNRPFSTTDPSVTDSPPAPSPPIGPAEATDGNDWCSQLSTVRSVHNAADQALRRQASLPMQLIEFPSSPPPPFSRPPE